MKYAIKIISLFYCDFLSGCWGDIAWLSVILSFLGGFCVLLDARLSCVMSWVHWKVHMFVFWFDSYGQFSSSGE